MSINTEKMYKTNAHKWKQKSILNHYPQFSEKTLSSELVVQYSQRTAKAHYEIIIISIIIIIMQTRAVNYTCQQMVMNNCVFLFHYDEICCKTQKVEIIKIGLFKKHRKDVIQYVIHYFKTMLHESNMSWQVLYDIIVS